MSGSGSKAWTAILVILLILLLAGLTGFCVYYFVYAGSGRPSLLYNGEELESGGTLGRLESGTEFRLLGGKGATVRIEAYAEAENDFPLQVGGTEYRWTDFSGRDMTNGFDIERSGLAGYETLTISYAGFEEIVQGSIGTELSVAAGEITEAWFRLVLEPGGTEVYFSVAIDLEITLDPPYIIF